MRILGTRQMREADRRTIEDLGVPASVLMENAGAAVADTISSVRGNVTGQHVVVFAGKGNNGGDGFVVSDRLLMQGAAVTTLIVGRAADIAGHAAEKLERLLAHGGDVREMPTPESWAAERGTVLDADLVVDAIVGTGFVPPLRGVAALIAADLSGTRVPVVAVDLPSGLSADSAEVVGPVLRASFTVALAAPKASLVALPGAEYAGRLVVADIGIPKRVIDAIDGDWIEATTREDAARLVPRRRADSHKGHYGHVVIVAGSRGKTGAAVLAARAALRSGAGLVTIATPASLAPIVAAHDPEVMTLALPESIDGVVAADAVAALEACGGDVFVVGPGLGAGESVVSLVISLLQFERPLVLDADALNALSASAGHLSAHRGSVVVTPHPGEMARLMGTSTSEVQRRRIDVARTFSQTHGVEVVLKGHRTVVASPGGRTSLNLSGNPGMATAGSGDVLAGVIGAWVAQLGDVAASARLGTYVHGLAGDLAARQTGQVALIASDIVNHLGAAVLALTGPSSEESSW